MNPRRIAFAALALTSFLCVALPPSPAAGAAKDAAADMAADKPLVDLNSATPEELQKLPGVSATVAKKIIAGRPYASIDDLSKAGISRTTLAKIKSLVTVADTAPPRDPAADNVAGKSLVDLNSVTPEELRKLPGVNAAVAKKIIAGRPYTSVDDLSKTGIPKTTLSKIRPLVTVAEAAPPKPDATPKPDTPPTPQKEADAPKPADGDKADFSGPTPAPEKPIDVPTIPASDKVNLNTAKSDDLEQLPGIGPATAKKIIAGRPYKSFDDLTRAGIAKTTIAKFERFTTLGDTVPEKAVVTPAPAKDADAASAKTPATPVPEKETGAPKAAAPDKIDLNAATAKELEGLPGVDPAISKKIIAGRPYKSVDDLAKSGISKATLAKIEPLVTITDGGPAEPGATPAAEKESPSQPPVARKPPVKGMVWVDRATKIYHMEGDPWYGKTKTGRFMTEADAIAAGYREARLDKKTDSTSDARDDSKSTNDPSK